MDMLHTNPGFYERPFEFDPERFSDKKEVNKAARNFANFPFFAGRRSCIGSYLGEVMIKIVLRSIFTSFEVQESDESEKEIKNAMFDMAKINVELRPKIWNP